MFFDLDKARDINVSQNNKLLCAFASISLLFWSTPWVTAGVICSVSLPPKRSTRRGAFPFSEEVIGFLICIPKLKKDPVHVYFCSSVHDGTKSFFAEEGSGLNSTISKCNNTLLSAMAKRKHISPNLLHPAKQYERFQFYTQNGLRKQNRV